MKNKTAEIFLKVLILGLQIAFAFALTFIVYYSPFSTVDQIFEVFEGRFDNIIGLAVSQPIMVAIISGLTILACLVVGLPIRLVSTINNWWTNHFAISVYGILLGIIMRILSDNSLFREFVKVTVEGVDQTNEIPNRVLSITGWFVTAFFALHVYPPKFVRTLLDKLISNIFPQTAQHSDETFN